MATTKNNGTKKVKMTIPRARIKNAPTETFVAVNGESYLIKHGEEVEVPDYIYECYMNSEKAKDEQFDNLLKAQEKMPKTDE